MAVLFMDSFNTGSTTQLNRRYTTVGTTVPAIESINNNAVPLHPGVDRVLRLASGGAETSVNRVIASTETLIVGFWIYFPTASPDTAAPILYLRDSGTTHIDLRMDSSRRLVITRNGTVLATSTNSAAANTWYHVELKVTIGDAGDTPSGRYQLRVNGTATGWIADSGVGQDTRNGVNKSVNQVILRNQNGPSICYSGFYILDTSGSVAADFLGITRVVALNPTGPGNYSEWTPNYAGNHVNVADEMCDDDNSFNQSSTANQIDSFPLHELPAGATVYGVQHVIIARQDAGAGRTIAPLARISSTNYLGTNYATGVSYGADIEPLTISPASAAQWTVAEINGAEFGYKLIA
jgi:hypothetical protein